MELLLYKQLFSKRLHQKWPHISLNNIARSSGLRRFAARGEGRELEASFGLDSAKAPRGQEPGDWFGRCVSGFEARKPRPHGPRGRALHCSAAELKVPF